MHHPYRDAHPLGWVIVAALAMLTAAGVAGALPPLIGA